MKKEELIKYLTIIFIAILAMALVKYQILPSILHQGQILYYEKEYDLGDICAVNRCNYYYGNKVKSAISFNLRNLVGDKYEKLVQGKFKATYSDVVHYEVYQDVAVFDLYYNCLVGEWATTPCQGNLGDIGTWMNEELEYKLHSFCGEDLQYVFKYRKSGTWESNWYSKSFLDGIYNLFPGNSLPVSVCGNPAAGAPGHQISASSWHLYFIGEFQAVCGDGACDSEVENLQNCPSDCHVCGDGICTSPYETAENCPQDCPPRPVCGNGICESGETPENCPQDCPAIPTPYFVLVPYLVVASIIIIVAVVVVLRIKRR